MLGPIVVITGVTGSGKSALARLLALELGWEWLEGEDLHPAEQLAKMAAGSPLDPIDRGIWLDAIAGWMARWEQSGKSALVTVAALSVADRDRLAGSSTIFVRLDGTRPEFASRIAGRHGHFIASALLDDQLARSEPLADHEVGITVDAGDGPAVLAAQIIGRLGLPRRPPGGVRQRPA